MSIKPVPLDCNLSRQPIVPKEEISYNFGIAYEEEEKKEEEEEEVTRILLSPLLRWLTCTFNRCFRLLRLRPIANAYDAWSSTNRVLPKNQQESLDRPTGIGSLRRSGTD